jgi:hypothetical protein
MPLTDLSDLNNTDLQGILQFPSIDFSFFWPFIQFALFAVIVLASYFNEKERVGRGNFLSSLAVGGFVSIVFGAIFWISNLIDGTTLAITLTLGIIFIAIYMLTRK